MNKKKKERIKRFILLKLGEILLLSFVIWSSFIIGENILPHCPTDDSFWSCINSDTIFGKIQFTIFGFITLLSGLLTLALLLYLLIKWITANWEWAK